MTAMPSSPGGRSRAGLAAALGAGWLLLVAAACTYARLTAIPVWAAIPVGASFLIEIPFYLSPAFSSVRAWLASQGKVRTACWLVLSSLIPWIVYSIPTGEAHLAMFGMLLGAAAI